MGLEQFAVCVNRVNYQQNLMQFESVQLSLMQIEQKMPVKKVINKMNKNKSH